MWSSVVCLACHVGVQSENSIIRSRSFVYTSYSEDRTNPVVKRLNIGQPGEGSETGKASAHVDVQAFFHSLSKATQHVEFKHIYRGFRVDGPGTLRCL